MRAYVWMVAVGLVVGPMLLVGGSHSGAAEEGAVGRYVLREGPVAASTDDVAVVAAAGAEGEVQGEASGSVLESLGWTAAAGALVLALSGGLAAGETGVKRVVPMGGRRRWIRSGWFAVAKAGRWTTGVGRAEGAE